MIPFDVVVALLFGYKCTDLFLHNVFDFKVTRDGDEDPDLSTHASAQRRS